MLLLCFLNSFKWPLSCFVLKGYILKKKGKKRRKRKFSQNGVFKSCFYSLLFGRIWKCAWSITFGLLRQDQGKCLYSVCRVFPQRQKNHSCLISICEHKRKMPVKSWKKSSTCIWKSIRQGVEAGVTESMWKQKKEVTHLMVLPCVLEIEYSLLATRWKRHAATLPCRHAQPWVHT